MPKSSRKSARAASVPSERSGAPEAGSPKKPARASKLRAQTRKLLGKHYRAKYGVR